MGPIIIQGGMGAAVSAWQLARAVSRTGQLGVVSGTALDVVLARRLQLGDEGGDLRRALAAFPIAEMAERIIDRYFIAGGKTPNAPFQAHSMTGQNPTQVQMDLLVVSNFVEVYLAKEGHDGLVGINYLEKIQFPNLASIYGAMLAGVDYVLMGAGIPRTIPGILDSLAEGRPVELALDVKGADRGEKFFTRFDPNAFCGGVALPVSRPKFLAIVASATLATMLTRKATGYVDGFIIEGPTAGGHNAPPRGAPRRNERGEPLYGERDVVDLADFRAIGRPFWLAGSYGTAERVVEALRQGATGVQVGTAFAYCDQSGLDADVRRRVLQLSVRGKVDVFTDGDASPTGFPLKVIRLSETMSEPRTYEDRHRVCDLGYLRHAFKKEDGTLGWRCPSEPVDAYLRKGGDEHDTRGRKCICNGLLATVSVGQVRRGSGSEAMFVTSGDDAREVARFLASPEATGYSAESVVAHLLSAIAARKAIAG